MATIHRVHWTCPGCGKTYAVPSTAGLTVCPKCTSPEDDDTAEVTQWSLWQSLAMRVLVYVILIPAGIIGGFMLIGLFNSLFSPEQQSHIFEWLMIPLGLVLIVVIGIGGPLLYLLPSIVAHQRKHHNAAAITVLNIFFGWTFVMWVITLTWAFTNPPPRD